MIKCPICKDSQVNNIPHAKYLKCMKCGLYIKRKIISRNDIKRINENFLLSTCHAKKPGQSRIDNANKQLDLLEQYMQPGIIYDIGAASGFFIKAAIDRGWKAYGNEISKAAIKWGKEKYGINVEYGLLEEIKVKNNFYNVIVLWNTLEHTFNPYQTLKIAKQMLKKNGLIYIRIPIKSNTNELNKYYTNRHTFEFPPGCLPYILSKKFNFVSELIRPYRPLTGAPFADFLFRKKQ